MAGSIFDFYRNSLCQNWWTWGVPPSLPLACHASALLIELQARSMAASRVQSPFVFTDAGLAPPGLIAVSALPQNGGQGGSCTHRPRGLSSRGLLVSVTWPKWCAWQDSHLHGLAAGRLSTYWVCYFPTRANWSGCPGLNREPLRPKRSALPIELHPESGSA